MILYMFSLSKKQLKQGAVTFSYQPEKYKKWSRSFVVSFSPFSSCVD